MTVDELTGQLARQMNAIDDKFPALFESLGRAFDCQDGNIETPAVRGRVREISEARAEYRRLSTLKDNIELEVSRILRAKMAEVAL